MLQIPQNFNLKSNIIIVIKDKEIDNIRRISNMKNIAEKLKSSTSLMITYGILSIVSMIAGIFWNITKYGFQ